MCVERHLRRGNTGTHRSAPGPGLDSALSVYLRPSSLQPRPHATASELTSLCAESGGLTRASRTLQQSGVKMLFPVYSMSRVSKKLFLPPHEAFPPTAQTSTDHNKSGAKGEGPLVMTQTAVFVCLSCVTSFRRHLETYFTHVHFSFHIRFVINK